MDSLGFQAFRLFYNQSPGRMLTKMSLRKCNEQTGRKKEGKREIRENQTIKCLNCNSC